MTEDEHKQLECRVGMIAAAVLTLSAELNDENAEAMNNMARCSGSKCGHWRWSGAAYWAGDTSGHTPEESGAVTVRDGFCGLKSGP